jgi:hypothetical protein
LNITHELQSAQCLPNGDLSLKSRIHSIHWLSASGVTPQELSGLHGPPEPWLFDWSLTCSSQPRTLTGTIQTPASGGTEGTLTAVRRQWG